MTTEEAWYPILEKTPADLDIPGDGMVVVSRNLMDPDGLLLLMVKRHGFGTARQISPCLLGEREAFRCFVSHELSRLADKEATAR